MLQTAQMFVGESGCWLVVGLIALYRRYSNRQHAGYEAVSTSADADETPVDDAASINSEHTLLNNNNKNKNKKHVAKPGVTDGLLRGFGILLLALPAICDICGTTLMNAGLLMVAASIYQMTRGALVLFVGLFSVLFLKRHLHLFQWISLVGVVLGVALVGLAGAIWPDAKKVVDADSLVTVLNEDVGAEAVRVIVGVLLIAFAQIFTATQFVLEEFLLERSSIEPLEVVGWEGMFGFAVTLIVMLVLHFTVGVTDQGRYGMFDMVEGFRQMTQNNEVWVSSLLIILSIGYVIYPQSPLTPFSLYRPTANQKPDGQRLQLLRALGDAQRERDVAVDDRHVPDAVHLGGVSRARLGVLQVAPGRRLRPPRLLHLPLQRHR